MPSRAFAFALICLTASCQSSETAPPRGSTRPPIDAGIRRALAVRALEVSRTIPEFAQRLSRANGLERVADGLRAKPATGGDWRSASKIVVTLPATRDGVLRMAQSPEVYLEVSPASGSPGATDDVANAEVIDGASVLVEAARDTDAVYVGTGDGAEELRVLRSPSAPRDFHWRLQRGPKIASIRLVEGHVQALDATGSVRIESPPMFAVDARGTRRALATSLVDGTDTELVAHLDTDGLVYPVTVDPLWNFTTSPMTSKRTNMTATLLLSGKVLIYSGYDGSLPGEVVTAELYDESTDKFTSLGGVSPRSGHTATLLLDGSVLIAGGYSGVAYLATAYRYKDGGGFSSTGSMVTGRSGHTAVRIGGGNVLVAGGGAGSFGFSPLSSAEIYGDGTATWASTGSMASARLGHTMTLLNTGKVLVTGGENDLSIIQSTAELYDPSAGTWSAAAPMSARRESHTATLLPSGKVLVTGGRNLGGSLSTSEIYNPSTNSWSAAADATIPRESGAAFMLPPSGNVVLFGGNSGSVVSTSEVYDVAANKWQKVDDMKTARVRFAATLLASNYVLAVGGDGPSGPLASAEVFAQYTVGILCTKDGECLFSHCSDGYCCDTACAGACSACDIAGSYGLCATVPAGSAPHGTRSCGAYAKCGTGAACATTCGSDADCSAGYYCDGTSKCVPKKALGTACAAAKECTSSHCAPDGVCCTSDCTGKCESCDLTGKVGTCSPVTGVPDAPRPACTGTGVGTTCGEACDGTDTTKCVYPTGSTICSANACDPSTGIETHAKPCDGAGKCTDVAKSCVEYKCGTTACKTSCTADGDCASGFYCVAPKCVPVAGLGKPCSGASSCASTLFCTDGVCCGKSTCGAGSSCAVAGKEGTCFKVNGTTCSSPPECGSDQCIDGVCCDTACTGQCQACDVSGSVGTCTGVDGATHGTRAKCDDGGTEVCKGTTCKKTEPTKCVFANGIEKECKAKSCEAGGFVAPSFCDGAGGCKLSSPTSCGAYVCELPGGCRSDCVTTDHCAKGYVCKEKKCVPAGATCSPDGLASIPKEGGAPESCKPFRCGPDGTCKKNCASADDCAPGYGCNPDSKNCEQPSTGGTDASSGGCGCTEVRGGADQGAMLCVLAGFSLVIQRRRRRARP